jgi:hypothetical protein
MSAIELTPPELASLDPLTPPAPVAAVAPDQAQSMVKLEPGTLTSLNAKVQEFVTVVIGLHPHSDEFKHKVANIHHLGSAEIRSAASVSSRMLQRPTQALSSGLFDDGAPIARTLTDLRKTVEDLDPSRQGDLFTPKSCSASSRLATGCAIIFCNISRRRATSTPSCNRCITVRMNCARTTPPLSRRKLISGR